MQRQNHNSILIKTTWQTLTNTTSRHTLIPLLLANTLIFIYLEKKIKYRQTDGNEFLFNLRPFRTSNKKQSSNGDLLEASATRQSKIGTIL